MCLAPERFKGIIDLVAQFARGRDDRGLNGTSRWFQQMLEDRQHESGGLPCSGLPVNISGGPVRFA